MKPLKDESIEVSPKPPKVVQLNKGLIIGIAGLCVIIFSLIILNGYRRKVEPIPSHSSSLKVVTSTAETPDLSTFNPLPDSYEDASKIQSILHRGQGGEVPDSVKEEIMALKASQAQLLHQVETLKNQSLPGSGNDFPGKDLEADHSAIFFAGQAPMIQGPETAKAPASTDAKNKAGDQANTNVEHHYPTEYQSQNMQSQKADFINEKPSKDIYNLNGIQYPISTHIVQAGTIIPAVLQTELVSSLPGMITAVVGQNVYDSITGHELIIPKGSKLLGQYNSQISYGQTQLQAKFVRVIRPDGSSVTLSEGTSGVNAMGTSGFSDTVDNHWSSVIGSAALMAVFNIPSIVATNQMNNNYSYSNGVYSPGLGSTALASSLQAAGQSASQVGTSLANKSLNIQPTIIIHAGYQFSVMVTKDTILPPYHLRLGK